MAYLKSKYILSTVQYKYEKFCLLWPVQKKKLRNSVHLQPVLCLQPPVWNKVVPRCWTMVTREEPGSSLFFFRFILPCLRSVLEAVSAGAVVSLGERAVACVFHVRVRTGRVDSRRLAQGGCVPVPRVASFTRALGSLLCSQSGFSFFF